MLYLNYYIYRVEQVAHRVHTSQNCFCRVPPYTTAKFNPGCYYTSIMISKTENFKKSFIQQPLAHTKYLYLTVVYKVWFSRLRTVSRMGMCHFYVVHIGWVLCCLGWCAAVGSGCVHDVCRLITRPCPLVVPFPSGVDCVVMFGGGVRLGEPNCKLYYITVIHILYTYDLIVVSK